MKTLFTIILGFCFGIVGAQNYFTTQILNPDVDFHSVAETGNKDLLFVGSRYSQGLFLMKLSATGEYLWSKNFGDASYSESGGCILRSKDGNFVMVGVLVDNKTFKRKVVLTKIDGEVNILWSKVYDNYSYVALPITVNEDKDGNFLISGDLEKPEYRNLLSVYVRGHILTDKDGNVLNTFEYDAYKKHFVDMLCSLTTQDGGKIIAGTDMTLIGVPGISSNGEMYADSLIIIKESKNGGLEWRKNLGKSSDYWASIVKGNKDTYLIKLGSNRIINITDGGNIIFNKEFDFNHLYMSDLVGTQDGGAICYGHTSKLIEGKTFNQEDYVLYKFDSSGKLAWSKAFGDPVFDDGLYVLKEVTGGYIAISRTITEGMDTSYLTINKFDYNGNLTGIEEPVIAINSNNIKISKNELFILDKISVNTNYEIINIAGQTLLKGRIEEGSGIKLYAMNEGLYILKLSCPGQVSAAKFIYRKQ